MLRQQRVGCGIHLVLLQPSNFSVAWLGSGLRDFCGASEFAGLALSDTHLGRGSPNTVGPMLEAWFATLAPRLASNAPETLSLTRVEAFRGKQTGSSVALSCVNAA